ncbi:hypothetical protein HZA39_00420, partial [Candidatus Peregrinibacteria bacterium]|nr:hypothetical protein [Candidatus Peregrinibacteria bacterium]
MKNKKTLAVVSVILALTMLAGCGAPAKSPDEIVKNGIKNFWNTVDSGNIQLDVQATAEEIEAGKDGKKDQTSMNFVVLGKYDKKDKQNLKFDMNLSGDVTYLNIKYGGELALKM